MPSRGGPEIPGPPPRKDVIPLAGDPTNAWLSGDADVYVNFDPDTAVIPTDVTDPFDSGWDLIGLMNGSEGYTDSRDEDTEFLNAWGGRLVRVARKNFSTTRKFVALEDNETVRRLVWPGSTDDVLVVPSGARIERVKVAFESIDGDRIKRLISYYEAEITVDGDITENEDSLAEYPLIATIFGDGDGNLWHRQTTESGS